MAQIFDEGNVAVHIAAGSKKTVARCYDKRDEGFPIMVTIDLFTFYPVGFGEEQEDQILPDWRFVIEAMSACASHADELWEAWENLRDDLF